MTVMQITCKIIMILVYIGCILVYTSKRVLHCKIIEKVVHSGPCVYMYCIGNTLFVH